MSDTPQTPKAPSDETQSALAGAFVCLLANNNAIILAPPFPTTQIQGLENANQSLTTAVTHARFWMDTLSGNVQNAVQAVVDYQTTYSSLATSFAKYIAALENTPDGATPPSNTIANLEAAIAALQSQVQEQLYGAGGTAEAPLDQSVLATYNQLCQYQANVASDEKAFKAFLNVANSTSSGIPAEIANYQAAIAADNDAITKDSAMIAGGAAMIVTGIVICVVAVIAAPETGGASVALAGVVGVALATGGAAMIGVASTNLDKANSDIAAKQQQITADQQELGLLTTVANTAGNLATHTANIVGAMSTLMTTWQQLDNDLGDTVKALGMSEKDLMNWVKQNQPDSNPSYSLLGSILAGKLSAPQNDWKKAAATASTILSNLQNVLLFQLPNNTVPTQQNIAAAAQTQQQATLAQSLRVRTA